MSLSQQNLTFKEELSKLNDAQKAAVEQTEGPVLVLAGPGTGKTQLLSARIGNILLSTDAQSHNILCLTYTDAGTVAMRKRLLKFIGPEAYRVNIYTFHAFCNTVIQDNLEYFGVRDLQPVSELELIDVFVQLIDEFAAGNPLKKYTGDVYSNIGRLKSLFNTMKSEDFSTEFLNEKIDDYLESLPFHEDYIYKRANPKQGIKVGDLKVKQLEEETAKMENLRAAVNEISNYEKIMRGIRRYDFQDMINWVLKAFKENDTLLARYQEKYLYILVDEYQDTNGAQNEVLHFLTSFWESPNIFVVGDDDQSIYSFQGANLERIRTFVDKYEHDLLPVVLTENYRSLQGILDAAKALIENNKERLIYNPTLRQKIEGLHKDLIAKGPAAQLGTEQPVRIREYQNILQEEAGIVKELADRHARQSDLSDTAIIYRSHRSIANIMKSLDHLKIPYNARLRVNIFTLPFVKNIITLLQYLHEETLRPNSAEHLLFELMHYEFFSIDTRDIALIARDCAVKQNGEFRSWRGLIASRSRMLQLGLTSAGAISGLEENITYWLKALHNETLQTLFEKIITHGNILFFVMKSDDKVWLLEVLNTFFDFVKDESAKKPKIKIGDLLAVIQRMEDNSIPLPLHRISQSEKGVHLITAHSSKGLEFNTVFLINCTSDFWEKKRGNSFNFRLPDNVACTTDTNKVEEERRLFYVAMTRARQQLYISYPAMKPGDKDKDHATLEKSAFVAEILQKIKLPTEQVKLSEQEIVDHTFHTLVTPALDKVLLEKEFIADALKNYKLSVTHVNKYLRCPVSFYFENVLRVPSARSASMGFGNAIHYALEKLFNQMKASETLEFPSLQDFIAYFKTGMFRHASHFNDKEYASKMEYAGLLLPDYYNQYKDSWKKQVTVEYRLNNVELDGIPITGVLDKIEFDGRSCNVVDYKTGDPMRAREKLRGPDEKEPLGGDYWRQSVFYKILLDNDKTKRWNMVSGEIDFVQKAKGKAEFEKMKLIIHPEDLDIVKNQVRNTYQGIMSHQFSPGCGKADCRWCNFVKFNYRSDALVNQGSGEDEE